MSWSHRVSNVCSKMSYYSCLLRFHRHVINNNLMKMLLEFLVLSHLSYCLTVWGPSLAITFIPEASTNADLCSTVMLWTKEIRSCD